MDDLDQHRKKRLALLIASPPYNGDRTAFIKKAQLTKGRISQLLDPSESFGERAGQALAERLGMSDLRWFDKGEIQSKWTWPFALLTPEQLLSLPVEHLATVEKVALDLLALTQTRPTPAESQTDTVVSKKGQLKTWKLTTKRKNRSGTSDSTQGQPRKSSGG